MAGTLESSPPAQLSASPTKWRLPNTVVLRDGSTVQIRLGRDGDVSELQRFLDALSDDSLYSRFFSGAVEHGWAAARMLGKGLDGDVSLLAVTGPEQVVVAHAGFMSTNAGRAEVAFAVADGWQGRGLATLMLVQLAEMAAECGIGIFEAMVLPENHRMIQVFRDSGFTVRTRPTPGAVMLEFPVKMGEKVLKAYEERERLAAIAAVRTFLEPTSIAVVGASDRRGSVGGELFHNIVAAGYKGHLYPVSRRGSTIYGHEAFTSIGDVPEPVDLCVIAVPAGQVSAVARQCAAKNVRSLVVISAGFSEIGSEGAVLQADLLQICRGTGMRVVGPNCLGLFNTAPAVSLDSIFVPLHPPPGRVAMLTQSGGVGLALLGHARDTGLGVSSFVSVGNKADISGNDLIQYWESDPSTDVVLLYLESFGNPQKFARIARRVSGSKPIIAVKSGRSKAGARATSSHTGALVRASEVGVDALFRQAGVIRTDSLPEMFEVASVLSALPLPKGRRVGIVTNAGGPGVMCADACEALGLEVPGLEPATAARLAALLPAAAAVGNPVDMLAAAGPDQFAAAIDLVTRSGQVDALILIYIPAVGNGPSQYLQVIEQAALDASVPVLRCLMNTPRAEIGRPGGVFSFPEEAARALAHACDFASWRSRETGTVPEIHADADGATSVIAAGLGNGDGWLPPGQVQQLLSAYGIPLVEQRVVSTAAAAGRAAAELGTLVALKAVADGLIHKTDAGAVRLALGGRRAVTTAASTMRRELNERGLTPSGFIVQQMAERGVEMLVGVVHDQDFGPLVACGAGGITAELMEDVAVRITPLTDVDAAEMVRSLKSYRLLTGFRGAEPLDVNALEEILVRVAKLVQDYPEIVEMDLNPVIVHTGGALVVDARVRLEPARAELPTGAR